MKTIYKPLKPNAMKTKNFFSVLSLAIIFTGITAGFSNGVENRNSQASIMPGITHQVIIHFSALSKDVCNPYLVQIVDETGRLVAPAQVFIKGINKYVFYEKAPALGRTRMAVLIPVSYPQHFVCPNDFFTLPDVKMSPFKSGQIYTFDLYPTINGQGGE
jgi:hypothetical protein